MIGIPTNVRIYLHTRPTDMRKSFDGLSAIVRNVFRAEPTDGNLFLFLNRRCDRIKLLWWDRDGLALFYKRLEAGTYEMLKAADDSVALEIDTWQLAMLLGGVTLESAKRRKRYSRSEAIARKTEETTAGI